MTLPYAASRCNNKQCHYNIDGGSGEKPFEYISGGKEFRVYAANFSINGIGLNIPLLSCNSQNGQLQQPERWHLYHRCGYLFLR